jgi:hypothetical protein
MKAHFAVIRISFGFVLLATLFGNAPAMSDECVQIRKASVCEVFSAAQTVFLGTALEELANFGIRFRVDRSFKGEAEYSFDVYSDLICPSRPPFEAGKQYLIYAFRFPSSKANIFMPYSRFAEQAGEDLDYLIWHSAHNAFGYFYGTLRVLPGDWADTAYQQFQYSHRQFDGTPYDPARNVTIKIKGEDREFTIKTNDEGRFSLGGLPSGKYQIEVPGYNIRLEPEIIALPNNGCFEANLFIKNKQ